MVESLEKKLLAAEKAVAELGSVLVALSGGVDSSLLLAVAARALGPENVLAVTALGAQESEEAAASAKEIARLTGAPHRLLDLDPFDTPGFAENTPERCYLCRGQLFATLEESAPPRAWEPSWMGLSRTTPTTTAPEPGRQLRPV